MLDFEQTEVLLRARRDIRAHGINDSQMSSPCPIEPRNQVFLFDFCKNPMTEEWQHGERVIDPVRHSSNGDMHVYRVYCYAEKHITLLMQILFDGRLTQALPLSAGFQHVIGYKDYGVFCIKNHASRRVEGTH